MSKPHNHTHTSVSQRFLRSAASTMRLKSVPLPALLKLGENAITAELYKQYVVYRRSYHPISRLPSQLAALATRNIPSIPSIATRREHQIVFNSH